MSKIEKMRFWGTSAGEGIPTPFCKCRVCEYARRHGGKDLRTRSGFRINEKIMIDAGQDFVSQSIKYREDTYDLEHILYSHTHPDHYNDQLMWLRFVARDTNFSKKLNIYCTEDTAKVIENTYKNKLNLIEDKLVIHKLEFYKTYEIEDFKITPLKGHHHTEFEEFSANYIIEFPSGKKMYYALDSGIYLEETFEYLKNIKLDLLIGECTATAENTGSTVHMDLTEAKNTMDKLWEQGTIDKNTVLYFTHICGFALTHNELEEYWNKKTDKYKINIAYDGLSIDDETKMFAEK